MRSRRRKDGRTISPFSDGLASFGELEARYQGELETLVGPMAGGGAVEEDQEGLRDTSLGGSSARVARDREVQEQ